jgi:hypothetical protein
MNLRVLNRLLAHGIFILYPFLNFRRSNREVEVIEFGDHDFILDLLIVLSVDVDWNYNIDIAGV